MIEPPRSAVDKPRRIKRPYQVGESELWVDPIRQLTPSFVVYDLHEWR